VTCVKWMFLIAGTTDPNTAGLAPPSLAVCVVLLAPERMKERILEMATGGAGSLDRASMQCSCSCIRHLTEMGFETALEVATLDVRQERYLWIGETQQCVVQEEGMKRSTGATSQGTSNERFEERASIDMCRP